jgi:hypothetical protein
VNCNEVVQEKVLKTIPATLVIYPFPIKTDEGTGGGLSGTLQKKLILVMV